MNRNKIIDYVLIPCLLLMGIVGGFCGAYHANKNNHCKTTENDTLSHEKTIVVQYDSVDRLIPQPYPVKVVDSVYFGVASVVDTQAIIRQFYTEYILADSIHNKELYLTIVDTLYKNRIQGRFITYRILRPDSIIKEITTLKEPAKSHFFGGLTAGAYTISPSIIYNRKNKYMVGLSSNILLPSPNVQASIYFKIK